MTGSTVRREHAPKHALNLGVPMSIGPVESWGNGALTTPANSSMLRNFTESASPGQRSIIVKSQPGNQLAHVVQFPISKLESQNTTGAQLVKHGTQAELAFESSRSSVCVRDLTVRKSSSSVIILRQEAGNSRRIDELCGAFEAA